MTVRIVDYIRFTGSGSGGGGKTVSSAKLIGKIETTTTAFPTARKDGTALENGDYVVVNGKIKDEEFPIVVGSVQFDDPTDQGVYVNGEWILQRTRDEYTKSVGIVNKEKESVAGTSTTQAKVNQENVKLLKQLPLKNIQKQTEDDVKKVLRVQSDYTIDCEYLDIITECKTLPTKAPDEDVLYHITGESKLYFWDSTNKKYTAVGGGAVEDKEQVGIINKETTSFPTKRLDKTDLKDNDYCKVASDLKEEDFPIVVGDLTFNSIYDQAYYFDGKWYLDEGADQGGIKKVMKLPDLSIEDKFFYLYTEKWNDYKGTEHDTINLYCYSNERWVEVFREKDHLFKDVEELPDSENRKEQTFYRQFAYYKPMGALSNTIDLQPDYFSKDDVKNGEISIGELLNDNGTGYQGSKEDLLKINITALSTTLDTSKYVLLKRPTQTMSVLEKTDDSYNTIATGTNFTLEGSKVTLDVTDEEGTKTTTEIAITENIYVEPDNTYKTTYGVDKIQCQLLQNYSDIDTFLTYYYSKDEDKCYFVVEHIQSVSISINDDKSWQLGYTINGRHFERHIASWTASFDTSLVHGVYVDSYNGSTQTTKDYLDNVIATKSTTAGYSSAKQYSIGYFKDDEYYKLENVEDTPRVVKFLSNGENLPKEKETKFGTYDFTIGDTILINPSTALPFTAGGYNVRSYKDKFVYSGSSWFFYSDYLETLNATMPVGFVLQQIGSMSDPNTLYPDTEWTDITATYEGRYQRLDSENSVGTEVAAAMPDIYGYLTKGVSDNQYSCSGALRQGGGTRSRGWEGASGNDMSSFTFRASYYNSTLWKTDCTTPTPLTTTIKWWKRTR